MAFDPCRRCRRNPPSHLKDALVVTGHAPLENRFVMGNSVSEDPQVMQRYVSLFAGQLVSEWEYLPQRRSPERHLVIGLASGIKVPAGSEERNPEPEYESSHDI